MMRLFQSALNARTEESFKEHKEDMFKDTTYKKYPQWEKHLKENYFQDAQRVRSWALYIRYTERMTTHNSNTNNYVESSFRETKDNKFDRVKCFNLPELLSILMDHSASYKTKLADIGNNRVSNYRYNKSRYVGGKGEIKKEEIQDIEGGNFIVEDKKKNKFYNLNIFSGFCECGRGRTCGPCEHKNAVAYHFNVAGFSVIPEKDPLMRALWHYIAFGKTLKSHFYRGIKDTGKSIDVEQFIQERIEESKEDEEDMDISIPEPEANVEDVEVEEEEEEDYTQDEIDSFKDTWEQFGNKIIKEMESGKNIELKKSIKSVTKMMKKTMNSKKNTLIRQLIWFGKDQHKKRLKGKLQSAINVQPTAVK